MRPPTDTNNGQNFAISIGHGITLSDTVVVKFAWHQETFKKFSALMILNRIIGDI
jgi:hypothetical protein